MKYRDIATLLSPKQASWDWVRGFERYPGLAERVRRNNRALRQYVAGRIEPSSPAGAQAAQSDSGTEFFRYPYGCATDQLARLSSGAEAPPEVRAHRDRCRLVRP